MRRRRADREPRILFPWERRTRWLAWLRPRHARRVITAAVALGLFVACLAVARHRSRVHATRVAIDSIERAAAAFRADHGRCPSGLDELLRPPPSPAGETRYLAEARLDGWGRPFAFTCPSRKRPSAVDVVSGGPDATFGLDRIE